VEIVVPNWWIPPEPTRLRTDAKSGIDEEEIEKTKRQRTATARIKRLPGCARSRPKPCPNTGAAVRATRGT